MNKFSYSLGNHEVVFVFVTASVVRIDDSARGKTLVSDQTALRCAGGLRESGYTFTGAL